MTFKEVALKHLRETYDIEYEFINDDPLSIRAEFIEVIDGRSTLAYMFDEEIPNILLTGISGFEAALEDPRQITQILLVDAFTNISSNPYKHLPKLIPPFSTEIFEHKDSNFSVNLGDLIEEASNEDWGKELEDNFALWLANDHRFLSDQIYSAMINLESRINGITIAFLKSAFVCSFYDIMKDEATGEYEVDDLWDIFGWTLDLWEDWADNKNNDSDPIKTEIDIKKSSEPKPAAKNSTEEGWDDYNEQYFTNVE